MKEYSDYIRKSHKVDGTLDDLDKGKKAVNKK